MIACNDVESNPIATEIAGLAAREKGLSAIKGQLKRWESVHARRSDNWRVFENRDSINWPNNGSLTLASDDIDGRLRLLTLGFVSATRFMILLWSLRHKSELPFFHLNPFVIFFSALAELIWMSGRAALYWIQFWRYCPFNSNFVVSFGCFDLNSVKWEHLQVGEQDVVSTWHNLRSPAGD